MTNALGNVKDRICQLTDLCLNYDANQLLRLCLLTSPTALVVQIEQSVGCVCLCVSVCIRTITFELNDLSPRYLTRWFSLLVPRSCSKIKILGQSSRSQEETVAKAVGATSSG